MNERFVGRALDKLLKKYKIRRLPAPASLKLKRGEQEGKREESDWEFRKRAFRKIFPDHTVAGLEILLGKDKEIFTEADKALMVVAVVYEHILDNMDEFIEQFQEDLSGE